MNDTKQQLLSLEGTLDCTNNKTREKAHFSYFFLIYNHVAYRSSADVGRIHILGNLEIKQLVDLVFEIIHVFFEFM